MTVEILLIEDDAELRAIIEVSLSLDPNIRVHAISDAVQALTLGRASNSSFDLILLDADLRGTSGLALMTEIRFYNLFDKASFIVLYRHASAINELRFYANGAKLLLPMPFNPLRLAETVRAVLAS